MRWFATLAVLYLVGHHASRVLAASEGIATPKGEGHKRQPNAVAARQPLSETMEKLKANSSKWVHQRWPERRLFAWQEGYAALSVSDSNLSRVKDYIRAQEQHHARRSFREELVAILEHNHLPYDPRYVGP